MSGEIQEANRFGVLPEERLVAFERELGTSLPIKSLTRAIEPLVGT